MTSATNSSVHPFNSIDEKLLVAAVKLQNKGKLVDFSFGTEVKIGEFPLPSFKVKELGKNLQIPVSLQDIKIIRDTSEKSLISSKSGCNVGEASRQKQKTESVCSALGDPCLPALISHYLQLPTKLINVTARLKNLTLLEQSGKCYISNICSCCVDGKFGTVLLQLPVEGGHKGGRLNVKYKGRKEVFENHASSENHFYISAFYNCCEDSKETITQGHQLTLVYDLIWTNAKTSIPKDFPVFLTALKQIKVALKSWTKLYAKKQNYTDKESLSSDLDNSTDTDENSSEEKIVNDKCGDMLSENELKDNVLFFGLQEKYDHKTLSFKVLRGQDKKMAEFLLNCIFLDVHLALATPTTTGKKKVDSWNVRPYNQIEVKPEEDEEKDSVALSHLIDSDDVTRNLSLELNWNRHFVGLEPQQEKKVYNGIPGDKIDVDKRYLSVLLIWPKHHSTQIYGRYGGNEEPLISSTTKSDIVLGKIDLILPSWAYSPVSNLSSSLTATSPTTPPAGWTTPLTNTCEPRFDDCDSVFDGLASSTPRVGSSSRAISSGEDWVGAAEFKSHERNAAVKARKTSSVLKNSDWESVWKGSVTYKDMTFRVIMEVFDVKKPTNFMKSVMPLSLEVVGNIDKPERVWNYLKKVKETIDTEVIFLQCTPTSYADWHLYSAFCKTCQGIAVLGDVSSPIKNLYLFPILKGRPIPKELISLSSEIKLLENRASSLLLVILVMCKGQQKFNINDTARAVVPYKSLKIVTSLDKMNASNNSSYENSLPQNVIPMDMKAGPSSSDQSLNRAVIIRQQVQQEQDILRVYPIKTQINAHLAEQFAKTRTARWSPLQKNVPVAVLNRISAPVDGESRMQNALTFGSLTSTTLKSIGFHDPTPISKASTPTPNYAGRSTRATSQSKLVAEASKSTDLTNLTLVAKVLEPKSVKLLGDSTTSNEEWRLKDDLISGTLSVSSSSCLPLSCTTSSLRATKSKAESSLTTPKLKSESLNSTQLSDSYSSKSKISRERSPDSSKEEATPSKVAKINCKSTRTLARFSLNEAMWGCCQRTKDLVTDEATVKQIATDIEESLFCFLNKDVSGKYKNKYRFLIYSIKDRNIPEFLRDVITKKISPDELVRLSPKELTCKGFAEWREKRANLQLE